MTVLADSFRDIDVVSVIPGCGPLEPQLAARFQLVDNATYREPRNVLRDDELVHASTRRALELVPGGADELDELNQPARSFLPCALADVAIGNDVHCYVDPPTVASMMRSTEHANYKIKPPLMSMRALLGATR